jgi:hypothetical protein
MDKESIIRMAREAGLGTALCHNSIDGDRIWVEGADWHDEIERFAALVAAERHARACRIVTGLCISDNNAREICEAIRERDEK